MMFLSWLTIPIDNHCDQIMPATNQKKSRGTNEAGVVNEMEQKGLLLDLASEHEMMTVTLRH